LGNSDEYDKLPVLNRRQCQIDLDE